MQLMSSMEKVLVLLLVTVAAVVCMQADPRVKRQSLSGLDPNQIARMLNNAALVEAQHRCLIASDEDAVRICDRMGKKLRATLGDTIRHADCSKCTDQEKQNLVVVITIVRNKYPKVWDDIVSYYHITPEELKRLDDWCAQIQGKSTDTTESSAKSDGTAEPMTKSGTESPNSATETTK